MIKIDWKSLNEIGQEYIERLLDWADLHPRSYLQTKILEHMDVKGFRTFILCPPHLLKKQACPSRIPAKYFVSTYNSFFSSKGRDGINNAVWLTKRLDIRVCPYCNRAYIFTLKGRGTKSRSVRPELDHFYPKSNPKYKHLAISFYNLIPACPSCNHLKSTQIFDFHPYAGALSQTLTPPKIVVDLKAKNGIDVNGLFPEKPVVRIEPSNQNTQGLCLEELYKHHSDYAKELLDKIQAYNGSLYQPLIESFQSIGRTAEEINRLIWGNYIEEGNQTLRPLSKMTHDILEQFGIIVSLR